MTLNYYCIDAGSPYCPCQLAKIDSCLICSMLQGQEVCDCRWQGICIYQEYLWNRGEIQNQRTEIIATVAERKAVSEKLLVMKINIPVKDVIKEYNQPGTFAFLRPPDSPIFYNVPLCIMAADEDAGTLTVAVQIVGPKTKVLALEKDKVTIRGPYWNGLFGLNHIKSSYRKNWLVIGRGVGQALVIQVVKNLLRGNNHVITLLDPGLVKVNLAGEIIDNPEIKSEIININNRYANKRVNELLQNGGIDYVFSAGSDVQHETIKGMIEKTNKRIPLVISNNYQLCCGEGICGSCETLIQDKPIHLCKIQLNSMTILGE